MPEITVRHDARELVIGIGSDAVEAGRQAGLAQAAVGDAIAAVSLAQTEVGNAAAQADRSEAAAEASILLNGNVFESYADAAAATLVEGAVVEVVADETRDGSRTRYRQEGGSLVYKITLGIRLTLAPQCSVPHTPPNNVYPRVLPCCTAEAGFQP